MEINPQRVRSADFKTVKRGLDPEEVQGFLSAVADELERAQNQSTAMEARARAAVARLQELSEGAASQSEAAGVATESSEEIAASVDQSETISRTLLLAQRTADTAIAEAQAEAERLRSEAEEEAGKTLDSTREMAASLLDEARADARKAGEDERTALQSEVDSLLARRDFLESDVDHMEQFLIAQRERLRDAASQLIELTERVPGGLGEVRRPLMSASDDEPDDDPGDVESSGADTAADAAGNEDPTPAMGVTDDAGAGDGDDAADDAADDTADDSQATDGDGDDDGDGEADHVDDLWLPAEDDGPVVTTDAPAENARGFRLAFGDD